MNDKPYRIVDNSSLGVIGTPGVRIYDPQGVEITNMATQYIITITRSVAQRPRVRIEVLDEPRVVVDGEPNKKWLEGPVVCEIT